MYDAGARPEVYLREYADEFASASADVRAPRPPHLERIVELNRGPFVGGRSLDLAKGAAQAIGLHSTGSVRMVVLN